MGLQARRIVKGLDLVRRELALKTDLELVASGKFVTTGVLLKAVHQADDNQEVSTERRALTEGPEAQPNQEYASSGILNPRTRVYFYGHVTRPFSYEFSFQESYGTLNLLDSYINYRQSDGFNLQFGRFKSPYTYHHGHPRQAWINAYDGVFYRL